MLSKGMVLIPVNQLERKRHPDMSQRIVACCGADAHGLSMRGSGGKPEENEIVIMIIYL